MHEGRLHPPLFCSVAEGVLTSMCWVVAPLTFALQADPSNDPLEKFCDDNPDADECRWV